MIYSMTGFGRAEAKTPWGQLELEIKSVNNRFLEIQVRSPRILSSAESEIRKLISKKLVRGSVTVFLNLSESEDSTNSGISLNTIKASQYISALKKAKKTHKIQGEIDIRLLASIPGLFEKGRETPSPADVWRRLRKPLEHAVKKLTEMRAEEGKKLCEEMKNGLKKMSVSIGKIEKKVPVRLKEYAAKLRKNITELAKNQSVAEGRLETEIAIMADRMDIREECVRLKSHIHQFSEALKKGGAVGKRLNFLLQEMNREANTIGAKSNDADISGQSLYLKELIESIREQIQNIE